MEILFNISYVGKNSMCLVKAMEMSVVIEFYDYRNWKLSVRVGMAQSTEVYLLDYFIWEVPIAKCQRVGSQKL